MFKINVNQSCYDGEMMDMEMRLFLVKLSLSEPFSKNAAVLSQSKKSDWRWEITGYFCSLPEAEVGAWISSNTYQWKQPPVITPIKSMNIQPLSLQLYLEHPPPELWKCFSFIFLFIFGEEMTWDVLLICHAKSKWTCLFCWCVMPHGLWLMWMTFGSAFVDEVFVYVSSS